MATEKTFTLHPWTRAENFRPVLREPMRVERSFSLPPRISCDAISVVIPVKNNQEGIDRFLRSVASNLDPSGYPREIIIVDNNSDVMTSAHVECPVPVQVISCTRRGPGAARNEGVAHATGEWILFTDSDCMATASLVSGYVTDRVSAVAYAGNVETRVVDQCTNYYQEMNIFIAQPLATRNGVIPATLVTANSLVLKDAFLAVGGFNERFVYAGCEDTDLGYRLAMVGDLMYNLNSVAAHEITDGIQGFIERFMRYGRGTRLLDVHYDNPGLFVPQRPGQLADKTPAIRYLAQIQYHAMWWGYLAEKSPEYLVLPEGAQS